MRQIVELFALDGQVALSHVAAAVQASGITFQAVGGAAKLKLELWGMEQSVF